MKEDKNAAKDFILRNSAVNYMALNVNRDIMHRYGLNVAVAISALFDMWRAAGCVSGFFPCTVDAFEKMTTLSRYQQTDVFAILKEIDFIEVARKGQPALRYVKINF